MKSIQLNEQCILFYAIHNFVHILKRTTSALALQNNPKDTLLLCCANIGSWAIEPFISTCIRSHIASILINQRNETKRNENGVFSKEFPLGDGVKTRTQVLLHKLSFNLSFSRGFSLNLWTLSVFILKKVWRSLTMIIECEKERERE